MRHISTTKGKLKTRTIDIPVTLAEYLEEYQPPVNPYNPYLFNAINLNSSVAKIYEPSIDLGEVARKAPS